MISCLFCAVSLLYVYFVSKKILLLFIALLMFLFAAGCHQRLIKRVEFLEKQMSGIVDALKTQDSVNKSCYQIACKLSGYKDVREDDLK